MTIYTIGHSTRSGAELVRLLEAHGICMVVDVRGYPRSRRNPQFNSDELAALLSRHRIGYTHLRALGGMRKPSPRPSPNTALEHEGFRAYADYMQTDGFAAGLAELRRIAADSGPVSILCAEASWRHCHRRFISDALLAEGVEVRHIESLDPASPATMTDFATVRDGRVTYPAPQGDLFG